MSVAKFLHILQGPLARYHLFSQQIGGDVAIQSVVVSQAFQTQLQYLMYASYSDVPPSEEILKFTRPTDSCISIIHDIRNKNRSSPYLNHLSAVSEGIATLEWVALISAPIPFMVTAKNGVRYYTNQLLNDWRWKDKIHVEWTTAWLQTLTDLVKYVKQYHPTGLMWAGRPPPPSSILPGPSDKSPVFTKDGKKWLIEYQKGHRNFLIENAEMNNVAYLFKCIDSRVVIKRKINCIVLVSCSRTSVVFDSLVSGIEFINCQSVKMQVMGKVSSILVDKTDGCQIYLNHESLNAEVTSTRSSGLTILAPQQNGQYKELTVPVQHKITVTANGLETKVIF